MESIIYKYQRTENVCLTRLDGGVKRLLEPFREPVTQQVCG